MVRIWSLLFAAVALLGAAAFAYAPFHPEWWLPAGPDASLGHRHSASTLGRQVDELFVIILVVTGLVYIVTQGVMVYASWKYVDRPGRIATYFHGSQRLEFFLALLPAVALVFLTYWQFGTWAQIKFPSNAPKVSPTAEVVGRQFQWLVRYPGEDGKFQTSDDVQLVNDLHFVKDTPTLIELKTKDVIHSFYLPQLRIKQDAVPGLKIPVWFDADQAGKYEWACAELCGWGHYKMKGVVTVHATRAEFDEWLRGVAKEQRRDQVAAPAAVASTGPEGR